MKALGCGINCQLVMVHAALLTNAPSNGFRQFSSSGDDLPLGRGPPLDGKAP